VRVGLERCANGDEPHSEHASAAAHWEDMIEVSAAAIHLMQSQLGGHAALNPKEGAAQPGPIAAERTVLPHVNLVV
jgi:hypothetical protein